MSYAAKIAMEIRRQSFKNLCFLGSQALLGTFLGLFSLADISLAPDRISPNGNELFTPNSYTYALLGTGRPLK